MSDQDIQQALSHAEKVCDARGARLTHLRRRVLERILHTDGVIKAYDLIHDLSSQDRRIKPPTIYRSLAFLLEQGFIHRIESLNGFVLCSHLGDGTHETLLLICSECGSIAEHTEEKVSQALEHITAKQGFRAATKMMEIRGVCKHCRQDETRATLDITEAVAIDEVATEASPAEKPKARSRSKKVKDAVAS